ncbi:MAG: GTPase [Actinomycetota bacterium]
MGSRAVGVGVTRPSEAPPSLLHLLHDIHRDVSTTVFPFDVPGTPHMREARARVMTQVQSHLLPRLADDATPAVVVLGGSTGVGKSTLFNSLVGHEASAAGVLRPTTRRAVIAHHPTVHQVPLRDLADAVAAPAVPAGLVVLDAPDMDSLEESNRAMADKLLEAADLWLFVTSASRYGDRIPWANLVRARDRGLQVGVVLNRVPAAARTTVRADLLAMLDRIGLGFAPVFLIPEVSLHHGPLPEPLVAELRGWLTAAAGRHQSRAIIKRTTTGAWAALGDALEDLATGVDEQAGVVRRLRSGTRAATRGPEEDIARALAAGDCAVGAPTTRWLSLASTGGPLEPLVDRGSVRAGLRGRARSVRTRAAAVLAADAVDAVTALLADALHDASRTVQRAWRDSDALALLDGDEVLDSEQAGERARAATASWRELVGGLLDASGIQPSGRAAATLEPAGLEDLVIAGAVGVAGAREAAIHLLGHQNICEEARAALVDVAREAVRGVASPYLAVLQPLPTPEHAARLRVRAQELRGHLDAA